MTLNEYLQKVLDAQHLANDSADLKAVREHRDKVTQLLTDTFEECSPTIKYGGSMAKGTMNKESYDLDIVCYFAHDDDGGGDNLPEIYNNAKAALAGEYHTEPRTSAIRLKSNQQEDYLKDFHVDVVPGRFTDANKGDCYIHQASGEKSRLKTNTKTHVKHIRDSGVVSAIRLFKLWNVRNGIDLKTFVMELMVIELLRGHKNLALDAQFRFVLEILSEDAQSVKVEDPANPTGNDLSVAFDDTKRLHVQTVATTSLSYIEDENWVALFGEVEDDNDKTTALASIVSSTGGGGSKPWSA